MQEFSVENLQFVVWYQVWLCASCVVHYYHLFFQNYRRRFLESAPNCHSRHVKDAKVHVPSRASIDRRVTKSNAGPPTSDEKGGASEQQMLNVMPEMHEVASPESDSIAAPSSIRPTVTQRQSSQTSNKPSCGPSVDPSSGDFADISNYELSPPSSAKELPFKEECMRVVATFLRSNSPKELNLDAAIRDAITRDLAHSTHPDVVSI
jgi:hypothetical protein